MSYLNTVPLVWGMLHGPQKGLVDLSFAVPSICADRVAGDEADLGILPVIEVERQGLEIIPGTGIACRGPVRTILLISRKPFDQIRVLATDSGSRTSVQLARIILAHRYGAEPVLLPMEPDLTRMLDSADAALIIGDAALHIDPLDLEFPTLDLGDEWTSWTGLPMVFAVWAGKASQIQPELQDLFTGSCQYGLEHLDSIIEKESETRGFPQWLVHQYLTRNISVLLGDEEYQGMRRYLSLAAELDKPAIVEVETAR